VKRNNNQFAVGNLISSRVLVSRKAAETKHIQKRYKFMTQAHRASRTNTDAGCSEISFQFASRALDEITRKFTCQY
jgi:hypothetical protein